MKERRQQETYAFLLGYLICFNSFVSSINKVFRFIVGGNTKIITYVLYLAVFVLLGYIVVNKLKSVSLQTFIFSSCWLIILLVTYIFHDENMKYMWTDFNDLLSNPLYKLILFGFPCFFLCQCITEIDVFFKIFEKMAVFSIVLSVMQYIIGVDSENGVPQYMSFSYNILLQITFVAILCVHEFKWYRFAVAVVGTVIIFIAGCRGALVSEVVCLIFYLLLFGKFSNKKKMMLLFLAVIVGIVVFLQFENIVTWIARTLAGIGIHSRTLSSIVNNSFFDDSGRGSYQQIIIENLNLLGHGLWGDRVLLSGHYVHNLFLELICNFGIFVGTIVSIWLLKVLIKAIIVSDSKHRIVLTAFLSTGFLKLMFSGSYLTNEAGFYAVLGMAVAVVYNHKVKAGIQNENSLDM